VSNFLRLQDVFLGFILGFVQSDHNPKYNPKFDIHDLTGTHIVTYSFGQLTDTIVILP